MKIIFNDNYLICFQSFLLKIIAILKNLKIHKSVCGRSLILGGQLNLRIYSSNFKHIAASRLLITNVHD